MAKKKSIYKCGGKIYTGGGPLDLSPYAGLGNMAGNATESMGSPIGTIGGSMLKGAASGAALGPWGAAAGAAIGGITGIIKNKKNQELIDAQERMMNQQNVMASLQAHQNANQMYANGGSLNQNANITEYNGMPHELGGLQLGENAEVENNETRGIGNTKDYIYSDSLYFNPKKKVTYADESKKIEKKYKNYENDKFALEAKDKLLTELMYDQESLKKNNMEKDLAMMASKYPELFQSQNNQYGGFLGQDQFLALGGVINMLPPTGDPPTGEPTNQSTNEEWVPGEVEFEKVLGKPEFLTDEDVISWNDRIIKKVGSQHTRTIPFQDLRKAQAKYAEKWDIGAQAMLNKVREKNPDIDFMTDLQERKKTLLSQGMKFKDMSEELANYAIKKYGDIYVKKQDVYGNLKPRDEAYYNRAEQMLRNRGALRHTPGVDPRGTNRISSAGTVDVDDSDFGWRNLIAPQFIQPEEQFKKIWNPGEMLQETYTVNKKYGGKIYDGNQPYPSFLDTQGIQLDPYQIDNSGVTPDNPYYGQQLNQNNIGYKQTNQNPINTPQYKTDFNKYEIPYDPTKTKQTLKYSDYKGPDYRWTNDKDFSYSKENVKNKLIEKGLEPGQVEYLLNTPGYAEQFYSSLAKDPTSDFSKSQFGDDDKLGPEHMLAAINNQRRIPGKESISPIQSLGPPQFNYQPNIDINLDNIYRKNSNPPIDTSPPGDGGAGYLKSFKPDLLGAGVSSLPNIGMGIGNLNLANNLQFQRTNAEIAQPDYVDPTRAIQESRNQYAGVKDTIRQNAGGTGNLMSNLIGATASQSEAQAGIQSQYDNANAGISNQFEQFNAQQKQQANNINSQIANQEEQLRTDLKQQGYEGLAQGLNTGINTYYQSKRDADKMNIAGGENFYYKRVGPTFNQTPVKVFEGNGYHYYNDPDTGKIKFINPDSGKEIKDKKQITEFNKDIKQNKNK